MLPPPARSSAPATAPALEMPRPARNMAALGRAIAARDGARRTRSRWPACSWTFICAADARRRAAGLLADCCERGFARGDTERMRLVLEALPHLVAPSRRTRRLDPAPILRRGARRSSKWWRPTCGGDPDVLASFLDDPEAWLDLGRRAAARRAARGRPQTRWRRTTAPARPARRPRTSQAPRRGGRACARRRAQRRAARARGRRTGGRGAPRRARRLGERAGAARRFGGRRRPNGSPRG